MCNQDTVDGVCDLVGYRVFHLRVDNSYLVTSNFYYFFGLQHLGTRAEFLVLQTGMAAFGKAYYRNMSDLVPYVGSQSYIHHDLFIFDSANK